MKNMYAVEHSDKILRHLTQFGTITSREAIDKYSVFRVDRCISYLKKQGYKFDIEPMEETKNGYKIVYFVYRLIENKRSD